MFLGEQTNKEPSENKQIPVPAVNKTKRKRRKIIESHRSGSEESYEPQFNQYKIVGLPVDMSRVTTGSWGLEENKIYLDFLRTYKRDFENEVARRKSTVFNRLSKALRKRTPDQCRSHHQKLQNRFKNNLDEIMEFVRSKIEKLTAETQDKPEKCRLAVTGTTEWEEEEALLIDLAELQLW